MNEWPHSLYLKITPIPSERTFNQFLHKNLSVQKRCGRCFSTIFCTKEKCIFGIFQPENAQFIFEVLLQNLFSTEFCGFPFLLAFPEPFFIYNSTGYNNNEHGSEYYRQQCRYLFFLFTLRFMDRFWLKDFFSRGFSS